MPTVRERQIEISMDGKGRCLDNVLVERQRLGEEVGGFIADIQEPLAGAIGTLQKNAHRCRARAASCPPERCKTEFFVEDPILIPGNPEHVPCTVEYVERRPSETGRPLGPSGPGSPGVFYNMPLGAERQIDWIGGFLRHLEKNGVGAAEPTTESEKAWAAEVAGIANATLFPRTDSWWTGANIEGKPRYFSAYLGGSIYYQRLADVAAQGYAGFSFEPAHAGDTAAA